MASKSAPLAVNVGTTATQLLASNTGRVAAVLFNAGAITIFLGRDNTVTTANGIPVPSMTMFTDDSSTDAWWAITASSTASVPVVEIA